MFLKGGYSMKLNFGIKNGDIIEISKVESGLKCGCICPSCGSQLIARKGNKKEHHFAHYKTKECDGYLETTLHLISKEIFKKNSVIKLPVYDIKEGYYCKNKIFKYSTAILEKKVNNIIPDIQLKFFNNNRIFVEIKVTHEVDDEKIEKLKSIGISTLEINLEDIYKSDDVLEYQELEKILIFGINRKSWVYDKNKDTNLKKHLKYLKDEELRLEKEREEKLAFQKRYKEELLETGVVGSLWLDNKENLSGDIMYDGEFHNLVFNRFYGTKENSPTYLLKYKKDSSAYLIEYDEYEVSLYPKKRKGALWSNKRYFAKGYVQLDENKCSIKKKKN